jgi:hypothetical protein
MGDSWLQRLVVRGPKADLSAFCRAVESNARPYYRTVERQLQRQKLSFVRLRSSLPPALRRTLPVPDEEPWDLVVERPRRLKDQTLEVTYKFQLSRYEPELLILAASKIYHQLCFVVACVAPAADQQYSMFTHRGLHSLWNLPSRRKATILRKVPKETEDNGDDVFLALAEADWEMMDAVTRHWEDAAARVMANVPKSAPMAERRRKH